MWPTAGKVQELPTTGRTLPQETLEGGEIADGDQLIVNSTLNQQAASSQASATLTRHDKARKD